jgi:hypothetical protein
MILPFGGKQRPADLFSSTSLVRMVATRDCDGTTNWLANPLSSDGVERTSSRGPLASRFWWTTARKGVTMQALTIQAFVLPEVAL